MLHAFSLLAAQLWSQCKPYSYDGMSEGGWGGGSLRLTSNTLPRAPTNKVPPVNLEGSLAESLALTKHIYINKQCLASWEKS
jgi:hypothetical protein